MSQTTGYDLQIQNWVNAHLDLVCELPEPGQTYRFKDVIDNPEDFDTVEGSVPLDVPAVTRQLAQHSVIRSAGKIRDQDNRKRINIWETDERAYQHAQRSRAERDTYPCGHSSGFVTLDADAGEYACGFDYCNAVFDRETIEEVHR